MLHTKSQGHRPSGSGEEDFLRVFTIYGHGGHLGHVTKTIWTNFRSPILRSLHMKYEFNWPSSFRGEDVWKCWRTTDGRTDGRTTDAGVTGILLAHQWAFGSGELKSDGDIAIPSVRRTCYLLLNHWTKSNQIWCVCCSHEWGVQWHFFFCPAPWRGAKRSNIIKDH